jgi:hypothetical protein
MFGGDVQQSLRQQLGQGVDMRQPRETTGISANREALLDDMLDLILKHKKELKKVPAASHITTATEWAKKRGLSATTKDLDGDGTQETIVWDKSGRYPYVVNGYKLAQSDYPLRNAYWGSHTTAEDRAFEPMDDRVRDKVYHTTKNASNEWVTDRVELTEAGKKLKEWGYGMPTKPKKTMTPYAIFSKLIAGDVALAFEHKLMQQRLGVTNITNEDYAKILRKIVSPIHIYRALYIRMVEQKFYFKKIDENGGQPLTYKQFKKFLKEERGRNAFNKWFYEECLEGETKGELHHTKFNIGTVVDNLIPVPFSNIVWTNKLHEVNVLANLMSRNLWNETEPFVVIDSQGYTFKQVIQDDELAHQVMEILDDKSDSRHRMVKKNIEICKKFATASTQTYLDKANIANVICSHDAYLRYKEAKQQTGNENVVTPEGQAASVEAGGSPVKQRPDEE